MFVHRAFLKRVTIIRIIQFLLKKHQLVRNGVMIHNMHTTFANTRYNQSQKYAFVSNDSKFVIWE